MPSRLEKLAVELAIDQDLRIALDGGRPIRFGSIVLAAFFSFARLARSGLSR